MRSNMREFERKLQQEAERLIREGKMPSLEDLSKAVLEARKVYRLRILRARREAKENR